MTLRHSLMFRFRDDATEEQRRALFDGLARMPEAIEFIRRYEFGRDVGIREGNPDAALVADFDSAEDYMAYSTHPAHIELVENLFRPIVAEAIRVQYQVD